MVKMYGSRFRREHGLRYRGDGKDVSRASRLGSETLGTFEASHRVRAV